jgi:hypothetical protein
MIIFLYKYHPAENKNAGLCPALMNQKPQGELHLRLDDQRNELNRRYHLPGGGALRIQLWVAKMVVIFFPCLLS